MTDEQKPAKKPATRTTAKAPVKKAAPKKAPAVKTEAARAGDKAASPKKAVAKAAASGATIRLRQVGSPIGRQKKQRQTLIGLGLNKMHRERVLQDTPEVRGMIAKIPHLVTVVK